MITAVIISSESDYEQVSETISLLPTWVKKIVVKTVQGGESKVVEETDNISLYEYGYEKFRFDEARNFAVSKVKTDWFLTLDVDERVLISKEDVEALYKLPQSVWAGNVKIVCYTGDEKSGSGASYDIPRVFRRGVKYEYYCHETTEHWLAERGYEKCFTPIVIRHDGYWSDEAMKRKLIRNFNLILDNIEANRDNRSDPKLLGDLYRTLIGIERYGDNN